MSKVVASEFRLPDDSLVFDQKNILGAVSQAAGVPTGRIIEDGSNANGWYIRFADGTQVCFYQLVFGGEGVGLRNSTWTYPVSFSSGPRRYITKGTFPNVTSATVGHRTGGVSTSSAGEFSAECIEPSAGSFSMPVLAIGRWF